MGVSRGAGGAHELAAELRALRRRHDLTTREMAERVGTSNANITHWETGSRPIPAERLTAMLDALDVHGDDRERILGLKRLAEGPGYLAAGMPSIGEQLAQLIEYERTASRITDVAPLVLPGLLQTSDYARAVLGEGPDTETRVALRVGRADVVTRRRNPVEFIALIDSEVLVRPFAERDVMHDQLEHLLRMTELPNVTIQVVSSTRPGWHPAMAGPFILLEFPTATPIVHFEHYRASSFLWDERDVAVFVAAPDEIRKRAMTPDRTSEVIRKLVQGMEQQ
jgi:transcriptional regulator with XRE-family HTH domain